LRRRAHVQPRGCGVQFGVGAVLPRSNTPARIAARSVAGAAITPRAGFEDGLPRPSLGEGGRTTTSTRTKRPWNARRRSWKPTTAASVFTGPAQIFRDRNVDISTQHLMRAIRLFIAEEERGGREGFCRQGKASGASCSLRKRRRVRSNISSRSNLQLLLGRRNLRSNCASRGIWQGQVCRRCGGWNQRLSHERLTSQRLFQRRGLAPRKKRRSKKVGRWSWRRKGGVGGWGKSNRALDDLEVRIVGLRLSGSFRKDRAMPPHWAHLTSLRVISS
jgi:hypothetical protein